MRLKCGVAIEAREYGDDPWANGCSGGVGQKPQASKSHFGLPYG